jgi:hypothetical protein
MSDEITICVSGSRYTKVTVEIPASELHELFEDEFDGSCWKCETPLRAIDSNMLCCGCLEEEIDKHVSRECCDANTGVFEVEGDDNDPYD